MVTSSPGHASLIGATFAGYEVLGLIGRGAMGTVYLARDVALNRHVALKVLLGSLARNPQMVKSFHREAQAAAPLRHPNIVKVYSAGVEEGTPFIAMEYVAGEPLDRFLGRHGQLYWANALYIGGQVAEALDFAHQNGVIHRDIKPANVLLDCQGHVRLTDFGIANVASETNDVSQKGEFLGTPHYMSPEQCGGAEITSASDLYSLGVTLYRMIVGRPPFEAESPLALVKLICHEPATRLNKLNNMVPDDVARLVAHLMEKNPGDRPKDARTVCEMITRLQVEKGGRSVIPAALAAFIREQAKAPPLNVVTPTPWRSRLKKPPRGSASPAATVRRRSRLFTSIITGALLFVACIGVLGAEWKFYFSAADPGHAPLLSGATFEAVEPGVLLVRLPIVGYEIEETGWVGRRNVVMARLRGLMDGPAAGLWALVTVDLDGKRVLSLSAPSGSTLDPLFWRLPQPMPGPITIAAGAGGAPLSEALLLHAMHAAGAGGTPQVVSFAQKWDRAAPNPQAISRIPFNSWVMSFPALANGHRCSRAVPRPDGLAECLVLFDTVYGGNYLVERDVRRKPLDAMGPRLTTIGAPILPDSVCYSPDGFRLAYLRERSDGQRELWVVSTERHEVNGIPMGIGRIDESLSFSPDGATLAATITPENADHNEVRLLRTDDGAVIARLGEGKVVSECWHPDGDRMVILAPAPESDSVFQNQVYIVETRPPYQRRAVTWLNSGIRKCSVSRDGRWIVAILETQGEPTLAFIAFPPATGHPNIG
ncbi:MAG: serine/threonine-protein kinase [Candidatus Hydrogenedentes bacterium]|nr:serine/threonine-protein kinase [Candidatus Hydrogenedentota bacterium]